MGGIGIGGNFIDDSEWTHTLPGGAPSCVQPVSPRVSGRKVGPELYPWGLCKV